MKTQKNKKELLFAFLIGAILIACIGCDVSSWKNLTVVSEGYQDRFSYQGVLERTYAYNGEYQVELYTQEDSDERVKLLQVYYPAELRTSKKKYPLVLMANGTGVRASKYGAIFRHLASWGFIVVGNEDEWTWDGKSISKSLDIILKANSDSSSIFYQKVDTANVGLTGHSQGGMCVYTAASLFENSRLYRALCTQSGTATMLVDSLGKAFLKDIKAPMLLMGGCGDFDAKALCKLDELQKSYECIGSEHRVMGRIKATDHGDILPRGDAYMTAWMCYWLCGDREAGKCFVGEDAEIIRNKDWQDVKRDKL
ncbi:MAG: hypothetical protein IKU02_03370 [Bacteroidaceae bacterium]|nr:hypothetical protein [Bacteroidaceae bacterium]